MNGHVPAGRCPHCGYMIDPGQCSECGTIVAAAELLPLQSRFWTRRRLILAATAIVVLGGGLTAYWTVDIYEWLPTSLLLRWQAGSSARAESELARRFNAKSLTREQIQQFVKNTAIFRHLRFLQGDPPGSRPPGYALRHAPRSRLPKGQPFCFAHAFPGLWLSSIGPNLQLSGFSYSAVVNGREASVSWDQSPFLRVIPASAFSMGRNVVTVTASTILTWSGPAEMISISASVDVLVEDRPISDYVEAVTDEATGEAVRNALTVTARKRGQSTMMVHVTPTGPLPAAVVCDIDFRPAQSEPQPPSMTGSTGYFSSRKLKAPPDSIHVGKGLDGQSVDFVDVYLIPGPASEALKYPDVTKHYAKPLIWRKVPVQQSQSSPGGDW